ncbi:glutathione S-transferase family protein [Ruegeria pomeroyi]|uniref:glutathione transferase n=2 Tax=Ruegeria pomeroyi TaxID=89184 RepID=Q5LNE4_RUEPO|nr:glutathione S-transferase family protein [Ruegeria pomeroyi]AAV96496.1 glutathione S-transferase family protein [Ruegeria pomeroyi DSS-3]QWV10037.1 glutathione S-transferase family protein [Ruegeria pomeroyi]
MTLHLMSHALCPYVQRAAISMLEKGVSFERTDIDLAKKPEWFLAISPLGKTPVLLDNQQAIFESTAILEYLEDTQSPPLHSKAAITRAQHRGWIEFGSSILNDIAGLYNAQTEDAFDQKTAALEAKFAQLERQLGEGAFFAGNAFTLVDTVFAPIFRYFDTFDEIADFGILLGKEKVAAWRKELAARPSVKQAVSANYPSLLRVFLLNRNSHLSQLMKRQLS